VDLVVAGAGGSKAESDADPEKEAVRERVWAALRRHGVARFPGADGRIPNFVGAEAAAERLAETAEWQGAHVVKANPDAPQLPVRARALADGKVVFMAVPRLRDPKPFLRLDPRSLSVPPRKAASISGASRHGRPVSVGRMRPVDLVVCGSVAVNRKGGRVGKGGGFSDLEFALLAERGLIGEQTVIATTVHRLQLLDEDLPETDHDFRVNLIVTQEEVIRTPGRRRPSGIIWAHLGEERSRRSRSWPPWPGLGDHHRCHTLLREAHVANIEVQDVGEEEGRKRFVVTVSKAGDTSTHHVTLSREDYERWGINASDPAGFIRRCFEFLLEREPKESILSQFDVSDIPSYFPEFDREIQRLKG
jgi:5-formyltetrahydrofolate cyclo-ligase